MQKGERGFLKIFHVDMNSFFASCEQAVNPEYAKKPLVVCGDPENRAGIVLAASYEAKAFGIKTTMLCYEAKRLCPNAIFVPCRHRLYSEISRKVMAILDDFTPVKEQASLDEAYLDMTGTERLFGNSAAAARLIQQRIYDELHIGCSVGISTNKLLAKMASDMKKPMGITELYESDVPQKLWPLPVRELFGVGGKTAEKLEHYGITTVGGLAAMDEGWLCRTFGPATAKYLHEAANGRGSESLEPDGTVESRSVGNENTYSRDVTSMEEAFRELLFLCDSVGYRLRKEKKQARCVTVKIKYYDFKVVTRSRTLPLPFCDTDTLYKTASELFAANWSKKPVRLLGVTASGFDECEQITLFEDSAAEKHGAVDESVDSLRRRFGYNSVVRASLMEKKNKKL